MSAVSRSATPHTPATGTPATGTGTPGSTAATRPPARRSSRRGRVAPPAPVGLGSLTQPGARQATCRACGSDRVTAIAMSLTDGSPVRFTSCHRCEHRTWEEAGRSVLPVASVLDRARKR